MEVYLITCIITNKFYIGSTSQTKEERWRNQGWSHLNTAYSGDNRPLYKDIRKFGESNFNLTTLEIISDRSELIKEKIIGLRNISKNLVLIECIIFSMVLKLQEMVPK